MSLSPVSSSFLSCPFGSSPSTLMVLPIAGDITCGLPAATIMDHLPFLNILPFGLCKSLDNPMVAAATAAALGVLTPVPCMPMTMAPWAPASSTVVIKGNPALNNRGKLVCLWGGAIEITFPEEATTIIP